jgi:UTP--glucose-1-phosphate uridylyltransferase
MEGVLTLAGEGTRMLPWSRGLRKEFLPIHDRGQGGTTILKPVAHLALESLVGAGADSITLVVSLRDIATAKSYFSVDREFLERHGHHSERLTETQRFYDTLGRLKIHFEVQPEPLGFGDAVLRARSAVGHEPFLLHAADAVLWEHTRGHTLRVLAALREAEDLDAVLLVRHVADPRRYGVVEGTSAGRYRGYRRLDVLRMEEKPSKPKSAWAATAVYAFSPELFTALDRVRRRDHPKELEVTDAIRELLSGGGRVAALVLSQSVGSWRSVGSLEGYMRAFHQSRAWTKSPVHRVPS